MNNKVSPRLPVFVLIGLFALFSFGAFVNRYVLRSQAAQSKLSVQFSPPTGGTLSDTPFRIVLKPDALNDKVSGADVVLTVQNGTITSWLPCKSLEEGKTPQIQTLLERTGPSPRYSCVILDKDENLVNGLVMSGMVQCSGTGPVTITLDSQKSQVSGPVEGNVYGLNAAQTITYNCAGGGTNPTPMPATDVTADFEPTVCRGGKGSACNYGLTIKATDGKRKISGYYVKVTFDKLMLKGKNPSGPAGVKGLLAQAPVVAPTAVPHATPPSNVNPGVPAPTAVVGPTAAAPTSGVAPTGGIAPTGTTSDRSCATDQDCVNKFCGGVPKCVANIYCNKPTGSATGVCMFKGGGMPGVTPPVGGATPPVGGGPAPIAQPPTESTCSVLKTNVNNEVGTMEIMYACDSTSAELKTSYTNTLPFDAIAEGEGTLNIADIQVVGPEAVAGLYTVNKGTAKYIIGAGDGNVDVKLKLRLQGITKKPSKKDSMQVRIGIGDGGLESPVYKTVEFKSDANGHFIGAANFNVPSRKDYKILIKCQHCLQRKVCDKDAKETEAGTYSCDKGKVELKNGENSFDLTGIVQLACDVPTGSPAKQDGVCNSADFAQVRNNLGKSDEEALKRGDLNFDGIVNAVDFSLMSASRINFADIK